jgi:SagB-type dehydrogenase family enzyme
MKSPIAVMVALGAALLIIATGFGCAQVAPTTAAVAPPAEIALPAPSLVGTVSVEAALAKRRSVRSFAPQALTLEQISQLAWAAQGITDAKTGHRTAPSARAVYPMTVYLVKSDGVFEYVPDGHRLRKLFADDRRAAVSTQSAVQQAAVDFVIVGDAAKAHAQFRDRAERWMAVEAGLIAENIHLQAVALGLASVTVGGFTDADVTKVLSLPADRTPMLVIPVGVAR